MDVTYYLEPEITTLVQWTNTPHVNWRCLESNSALRALNLLIPVSGNQHCFCSTPRSSSDIVSVLSKNLTVCFITWAVWLRSSRGQTLLHRKRVCQYSISGEHAESTRCQTLALFACSSSFSQLCWAGHLGRWSLLCVNHSHCVEILPPSCLAYFLGKTWPICPK